MKTKSKKRISKTLCFKSMKSMLISELRWSLMKFQIKTRNLNKEENLFFKRNLLIKKDTCYQALSEFHLIRWIHHCWCSLNKSKSFLMFEAQLKQNYKAFMCKKCQAVDRHKNLLLCQVLKLISFENVKVRKKTGTIIYRILK